MKRRDFINLGMVSAGIAFTKKKGHSMEFYPRASKVKLAVLYGTWYGTARDAGIWISEGMGGIAHVFDVREKPDLNQFDHLIIGTAIQGGKGPKTLNSYIKDNISQIKSKTKGLYVVCGTMGNIPGETQIKGYIDNYLAKICQVDSPIKQAFGGRITKRLLTKEDFDGLASFHKRLKKPFDDYDHLLRWQCMGFGERVLNKINS